MQFCMLLPISQWGWLCICMRLINCIWDIESQSFICRKTLSKYLCLITILREIKISTWACNKIVYKYEPMYLYKKIILESFSFILLKQDSVFKLHLWNFFECIIICLGIVLCYINNYKGKIIFQVSLATSFVTSRKCKLSIFTVFGKSVGVKVIPV